MILLVTGPTTTNLQIAYVFDCLVFLSVNKQQGRFFILGLDLTIGLIHVIAQ